MRCQVSPPGPRCRSPVIYLVVQDASVNLLVSGASVYHLLVPDASIYHSVSDPYHLAGSGPVSDDTDPDPGSAKIMPKTMKKKNLVKNTIYTKKKNLGV